MIIVPFYHQISFARAETRDPASSAVSRLSLSRETPDFQQTAVSVSSFNASYTVSSSLILQ
jgi:hypothetical protein